MKNTGAFAFIHAATLLVASACHLCAQVVADGATNTLNNVTNTILGDVTVGTNGSFTLLILTNNALLTNSGFAFIGRNAVANSNTVNLVGTNTRWKILKDLLVGSNGAFNSLLLSNSSLAAGSNGIVGSGATSSNNSVVVTGTNSIWTNSGFLAVGDSGSGNTLLVTNGGAAQAVSAFVGQSAGSNNLLSVGGGTLTVTNAGGTAALDVRRGGIAFNGGTITADQLLLTNGAGTFTFNAGLLATRTATITNGRDFFVGANAGFAPATWNLLSNATPTVLNKGLIIGSNAANSTLLLTNGATLSVGSGAFTLLFGTPPPSSAVGFSVASTNNLATVADPNSLWTNSNQLIIGYNGSANTLLITNGGRVVNSEGYLGVNATASNNRVIVTGTNSVWTNRFSASLSVGHSGSGNIMIVTNSGAVFSSGSIGSLPGSSNNLVIVTGANSQWSGNANFFFIGDSGANNTLLVTNGGRVVNNGIQLGGETGGDNNQAIVTGSNSLLAARVVFEVGHHGSGNALLITNGGQVTNGSYAVVGNQGRNNRVTVTGPGSTWISSQAMNVGLYFGNNTLEIANGGTVVSELGEVGSVSTAATNLVIVSGSGSVWSNYNRFLRVAESGSFNTALVTNGGLVTSVGGIVGSSSFAANNQVIVIGTNSLWNNSSNLTVGDSGAFNRLLVSDGGRVANTSAVIGNTSSGRSNQVVVTGPNAVWTNNGDVQLGGLGSWNSLVVSNGGRVADTLAYVGYTSDSNQVTVTGPNSVWTNSSLLLFGFGGAGNTLLITNGGNVADSLGRVGSNPDATNNQITVTGPGSAWLNSSDLSVGEISARNSLLITNGGRVADAAGFLGRYGDSNLVTVTGSGSVWSNASFVEIGYYGWGNQLLVTNGGLVQATGVYMGSGGYGGASLLSVGNGSLIATNAGGTAVLDVSRGSAILNGGNITADQLVLDNDAGAPGALGTLAFNSGTLAIRGGTVNNGLAFFVGAGASAANLFLGGAGPYTFANGLVTASNASVNFSSGVLISSGTTNYSGQPFTVGNNTSSATLKLAGNGTHLFGPGLVLASNATLAGNGTIGGGLTVTSGAKLSPGASIGRMVFISAPSLQGATLMEISKNGAALTNDQIQVTGTLTYGGSLIVSNLGPTALAVGDNFKLFTAGPFAGSFATRSLPPLDAGLGWTNKLLVDGSIEVISVPPPNFTSIALSGTNLIISGINGAPNEPYAVLTGTNLALPSSNWVSLVTNQFDSSGNFSFTNAIAPNEFQRYFRIRTP